MIKQQETTKYKHNTHPQKINNDIMIGYKRFFEQIFIGLLQKSAYVSVVMIIQLSVHLIRFKYA